jgi:hypothetical protein
MFVHLHEPIIRLKISGKCCQMEIRNRRGQFGEALIRLLKIVFSILRELREYTLGARQELELLKRLRHPEQQATVHLKRRTAV